MGKDSGKLGGGYSPTILARARNSGDGQPVLFILQHSRDEDGKIMKYTEKNHTGSLHSSSGGSDNTANVVVSGWKIRRLTPTEGERLQGLKDGWTKYGIFEKQVWINKKLKTFKIVQGLHEISDTQRFKMIGNGISIPPAKAVAAKLLKSYSQSMTKEK